jgi:hypothetical protein
MPPCIFASVNDTIEPAFAMSCLGLEREREREPASESPRNVLSVESRSVTLL